MSSAFSTALARLESEREPRTTWTLLRARATVLRDNMLAVVVVGVQPVQVGWAYPSVLGYGDETLASVRIMLLGASVRSVEHTNISSKRGLGYIAFHIERIIEDTIRG